MATYNLLNFQEKLPDFRRKQGIRHKLWDFVVMLVLAIISGHQGLRGFTRFMKVHESLLKEIFELKHGVPSYGTTRTLLMSLDQEALAEAFREWMRMYFPSDSEVWLAMDGKALASTVEDANGGSQSFAYVVSVFAHHSGLVFAQTGFNSGKASEADYVRQLITELNVEGVNYTLDALHCQKKHSTQ